jgi:RNA recognition motif-containing protein
MSKIFVGNLNFNLEESALETFIRDAGVAVSNVNIIRDAYSGRSRGFGFVELDESQDVDEAISTLNGKDLDGRTLRVDRAHERESRGPRGGGGGGGGGGGFKSRGW